MVGSGGHDSEVEIEKAHRGECDDDSRRPVALVVEIENRRTERYEVNVTVAVSPGESDPIVHVTVPVDWLHVAPPEQLVNVVFAGTASVTATPVALPEPVFWTSIV